MTGPLQPPEPDHSLKECGTTYPADDGPTNPIAGKYIRCLVSIHADCFRGHHPPSRHGHKISFAAVLTGQTISYGSEQ